ncbi:MAG TPA: hypothetical protein VGM82_01585 [Gemmatimonadaceae bacterium]|jgi:hypothetical protein
MPIFLTALIVAIADGLEPIIANFNRLGWNAPRRVFQSVASGVLGRPSFDGGTPTALLGAALHFTIALIWTAIYVLIIRKLGFVQRMMKTTGGLIALGAIYGIVIWCSMDYIVIPLSRATFTPPSNPAFWQQLVWHAVGVGQLIVWLTERVFAREARGVTDEQSYGRHASSPA